MVDWMRSFLAVCVASADAILLPLKGRASSGGRLTLPRYIAHAHVAREKTIAMRGLHGVFPPVNGVAMSTC